MDPRTAYIAYMEDLATLHVDIAHDSSTKAGTRFFLELDYEVILGWTEPQNTGWNLVLMGYETAMDDNRHGRQVEKVVCLFDVLKYCKADDPVALQATYTAARIIGEQLVARMHAAGKEPCDTLASPGITLPYRVHPGSKRTIEVGPRWDNYFGYRFSIDLLQDEDVQLQLDPAKWKTP